jgi:hypothetical protein
MKRRLGFLGLFLLGGVLVGGAIAWNQATRLPQWYTQNQLNRPDPTAQQFTARESALQVAEKLKSLRNPQTTITLDQQEINDVVTATIDQVSQKANIPQAIRGVNTELENGKLKAGAVIDFSKVQSGELSGQQQQVLAETIKRVPGLGDREVYVGIESTPQIRNGQVQLDPDTKVRIGAISLSLKDMANYVGVTPEQLQTEINQALPIVLADLPVQDVNVSDRQLVIRSSEAK